MSLTITIEGNAAADQLLQAAGPVTPAESRAMAAELARLVQRHLRLRDDTNAHQYPDGGRRSHFWRKAAQSVTFAADADGMTVSVTHQGVRLRYAGAPEGIKSARAGGSLSIPATGIAYGRLPREFSDLRIVVFKGKNKAALVQKPRDGEYLGLIMFWLVKRTKPIKADPTVIPPANVMLGLAVMRLRNLRSRKVSSNG